MNLLHTVKARAGRLALAVFMLVAMLPGMALASEHATHDIEQLVLGAFADVRTAVLALVAALFGLVILGIAIRVGVKYAKRGGAQA
jgi:hypothetical protein